MKNNDFSADVQRVQNMEQVARILDVCSRVTQMRFVAVARVTETSWVTCASLDKVNFGLKPGDELPIATTICNEIRDNRQLVVFDDATLDPRFIDHHTPQIYGLKSYLSVPIVTADGGFFGTLCAIDSEPRSVNNVQTIEMFKLFAELIATQLAAQDRSRQAEQALVEEQETGRLREEFIAVVGHDLRNPVASLSAGIRLMGRSAPQLNPILQEMSKSVIRMNGMISNLMDLARGRLGDGIVAEKRDNIDFAALVADIANEARAASGHTITIVSDVESKVSCDPQRIGQLVSNLLVNAVTHGTDDSVKVTLTEKDGSIELAVENKGEPIPEEILATQFEPFRRGDFPAVGGLGLGLYIASEIARAHEGTLSAQSVGNTITFTFRMPVGVVANK